MPKDPIFTEEQRQEIKAIVHEALTEFFLGYGRMSKTWIIGIATVVAALVVIFGGAKTLLGWLGFQYLK